MKPHNDPPLYAGTEYAHLDEPRSIAHVPRCVDCVNFQLDETCKQAVQADFVFGRLRYRKAHDVRYGDGALGLNCTTEGLWFIPK